MWTFHTRLPYLTCFPTYPRPIYTNCYLVRGYAATVSGHAFSVGVRGRSAPRRFISGHSSTDSGENVDSEQSAVTDVFEAISIFTGELRFSQSSRFSSHTCVHQGLVSRDPNMMFEPYENEVNQYQIDLPNSRPDDVMLQMCIAFDLEPGLSFLSQILTIRLTLILMTTEDDCIKTSAKSGIGIEKILPSIIRKVASIRRNRSAVEHDWSARASLPPQRSHRLEASPQAHVGRELSTGSSLCTRNGRK
jgi:hypothetical protein